MKKTLRFLLLFLVAWFSPIHGQNTIACDLNLANNLPDVTAECSVAFSSLTIPVITDSCNNTVTPTTDQSIFPISTLGTTTITWTYQDAQGGFDSQTQDIVIFDFTDPVPDIAFLPDIISECQLNEADLPIPTGTDNCSAIVTVTNNAVFPITAQGTTTITWIYADAAGNTTSRLQDVIIHDFVDPIPDLLVLPDIIGECEVTAADVPVPTATDNCSAVTVTNDAAFPITATGTTAIHWTYADAAGNTVTQVQDIIIHDFVDPIPDVAVLPDIMAECQLMEADMTIPTATDNCSAVTVTHDGIFPITASTTIHWTYTDAAGNTLVQPQDVIIHDFIDPVPDLTTLPDIIAECVLLSTGITTPTATDNCSAVTVTNDAIFPITTPGTTVITWTYTDAAGNSTTQGQDVIIFDFTDPVPDLAVLPDFVSNCPVTQSSLPVPTATDNCSGTVTVTSDAVFPITVPGATITWTYADASGNTVTKTQNVVVTADGIAPVPDLADLPILTAQCSLEQADLVLPTATDNCSAVTVTTDAVFPITVQGATTITWTYTDASGNTATQLQEVDIADTTFPTMTLTDITVAVDVLGNVAFTPQQLENGTATDNCGLASLSVSPNSFTCEELGDHLVTVTAVDINGNGISAFATVTVTDPNDFCGALSTDTESAAYFAFYPNPVSTVLHLWPRSGESIHSVKLYSLLGQLVSETAFNEKQQQYAVDVAQLATGTYLLSVTTESGKWTKRIIKSN